MLQKHPSEQLVLISVLLFCLFLWNTWERQIAESGNSAMKEQDANILSFPCHLYCARAQRPQRRETMRKVLLP